MATDDKAQEQTAKEQPAEQVKTEPVVQPKKIELAPPKAKVVEQPKVEVAADPAPGATVAPTTGVKVVIDLSKEEVDPTKASSGKGKNKSTKTGAASKKHDKYKAHLHEVLLPHLTERICADPEVLIILRDESVVKALKLPKAPAHSTLVWSLQPVLWEHNIFVFSGTHADGGKLCKFRRRTTEDVLPKGLGVPGSNPELDKELAAKAAAGQTAAPAADFDAEGAKQDAERRRIAADAVKKQQEDKANLEQQDAINAGVRVEVAIEKGVAPEQKDAEVVVSKIVETDPNWASKGQNKKQDNKQES